MSYRNFFVAREIAQHTGWNAGQILDACPSEDRLRAALKCVMKGTAVGLEEASAIITMRSE